MLRKSAKLIFTPIWVVQLCCSTRSSWYIVNFIFFSPFASNFTLPITWEKAVTTCTSEFRCWKNALVRKPAWTKLLCNLQYFHLRILEYKVVKKMGHLQVKREIFYHLASVELSTSFEYSSSKSHIFKPVSKSCGQKSVSAFWLYACIEWYHSFFGSLRSLIYLCDFCFDFSVLEGSIFRFFASPHDGTIFQI